MNDFKYICNLDYIFNKQLVYRDIDSITLVLNDKTGEFYELNSTGRLIFYMCKEELAISEMVDQISENFHVERDKIEISILNIIDRFIECGVINII